MGEDKKPTDQELVNQSLKDKEAFVVIVKRYEDSLLRYIRRLGCRDQDTAKDILQETFIKLYINLNDYDPSFSFSSWLYRIAHNEAVSHFRKESIRPRVLEAEEDLVLFENITDGTDIAAQIDREWTSRVVREAINTLESKYQNVFILKFFEQKSYDEISNILEILPGTVASLIHRGKRELRKILERHQSNKK